MARIKKNKDKQKKDEASVHEELKGLDLKINEFGEVIGNTDTEKINKFLNRHVNDKKLDDREGDYGDENPLDDYEGGATQDEEE